MTRLLAPSVGVSPSSPSLAERRRPPASERHGPASEKRLDPRDKALTDRATPGNRVNVIDRSKVDPQLVKGAEAMEGMFLDYMMKIMRDTVPESEMSLSNPATKIYQGMMDSETAQTAVRAGGVGLADQIIAWSEASRYNGPTEHAASPVRHPNEPSTGGTQNEGK